ncbi:MAG: hypothetical protein HY013_08205 [Candidatus Solibacter usitatus]|nr:hypothetical protein [Candidatus Solibacter usitatus]
MKLRWVLVSLLACAAAMGEQKSEAREAKIRFQNLTARASAMLDSIRTLEDRLHQQGLSLRADTVASRTRMELFMDEAEEELKAGRLKEARKAMSRAEGAIAKLETAMGAR